MFSTFRENNMVPVDTRLGGFFLEKGSPADVENVLMDFQKNHGASI
jgi:hypothetical protein